MPIPSVFLSDKFHRPHRYFDVTCIVNDSVLSYGEMAADHAREQHNFAITASERLPVTKEAQANPFSCNVCRRSYTRLDHLARHFRSRTTSPTSQAAG
jgi:uncharacterized Zn-finger protein